MDEARRRQIADCIALAKRARDETARSGGEVWLDRLESELGALRAALSAAEQAAAERVGRRMTLEEAAACALHARSGQPRRP